MPETRFPTPHGEVNAVLADLLVGARAILVDRFIGMYLDGSLALGDFDPESSDIDFVVVTGADVSDEAFAALAGLHGRLAAGPAKWGSELEGCYIPASALRRHDPDGAAHPHIERGRDETLRREQHGPSWVIQRHILRKHGIALAGPPPHTLIDPIGPDDLRAATGAVLREWWVPMLDEPFRLRHSGYHAYAVLTMCRIVYTLRHGTIVSKPVAARWAEQNSPPQFRTLIARARRHALGGEDLKDTFELIRYADRARVDAGF